MVLDAPSLTVAVMQEDELMLLTSPQGTNTFTIQLQRKGGRGGSKQAQIYFWILTHHLNGLFLSFQKIMKLTSMDEQNL